MLKVAFVLIGLTYLSYKILFAIYKHIFRL